MSCHVISCSEFPLSSSVPTCVRVRQINREETEERQTLETLDSIEGHLINEHHKHFRPKTCDVASL